MKRLLFLSVFFSIASTGFAQWRGNGSNCPDNNGQYGSYNVSSLVLSMAGNEVFTLVIDNGYQYQSNGNSVNIPGITAGNHTVTLYEYRRNIFGGQRQKIIFSNTVYFKPGIEHSIYINMFNQASFDERPVYQNGNYGNGGYGNNGTGRGWGYGRIKNKKHNHGGCDNGKGRGWDD